MVTISIQERDGLGMGLGHIQKEHTNAHHPEKLSLPLRRCLRTGSTGKPKLMNQLPMFGVRSERLAERGDMTSKGPRRRKQKLTEMPLPVTGRRRRRSEVMRGFLFTVLSCYATTAHHATVLSPVLSCPVLSVLEVHKQCHATVLSCHVMAKTCVQKCHAQPSHNKCHVSCPCYMLPSQSTLFPGRIIGMRYMRDVKFSRV